MFSFFKKSISPASTDKVWKTKANCYKGLATEVLQSMRDGTPAVVLTFFPADQDHLVQFLEREKVPHAVIHSGESLPPSSLYVADAFSIRRETLELFRERSKVIGFRVFFLGHYPLPETENKIMEQLNAHWGNFPTTFCLSLEDGLLRHFGSDRIKTMMDALQMKDDEFVEHTLVSRAIQNAREKLANDVVTESKTKSESDWFTRNVNSILN